eukprot:1652108-Rhodomonas_salina.2
MSRSTALRSRDGVSGTDVGYAATRPEGRPVGEAAWIWRGLVQTATCLRRCQGMSGTDVRRVVL